MKLSVQGFVNGPRSSTALKAGVAVSRAMRYEGTILQIPPIRTQTCDELRKTISSLKVLGENVLSVGVEENAAIRENERELRSLEREHKALLMTFNHIPASQRAARRSVDAQLTSLSVRILDTESRISGLTQDVSALVEYYRNDLEPLIKGLEATLGEKVARGECGTPPVNKTLGMNLQWAPFGPGEVKGTGTSTVLPQGDPRRSAHAADATSPLNAVKVVIPPSGSTPRQITNTLCPTQLPTATVSTTTNPNDTLTCAGGSLPIGQQFTLNVQTSPAPTPGMGLSGGDRG